MVEKTKITYKGESKMVPKTYVEGLKVMKEENK